MRSSAIVAWISAAALMLSLASYAQAHFAGNSWEYATGGWLMDIGYDTDVFVTGSYVRFDFSLKDEPTLELRDFAEVWVRIIGSDNRTELATGVHHQSLGPTTLLYVFRDAGSHTMEASFRDADGQDIATTTFPIAVQSSEGMPWPLAAAGALGLCLGAAGAWFASRRFKK